MQIYGKNVAREKLQTKDKIKKVYLSNKFKDNEIITLIKKRNINPILLDMRDLDKMCKGLHQGIILEVEDVKTYSLEDIIPNIDKEYPLVVLLDHIEDPHNFGAVGGILITVLVVVIIWPDRIATLKDGTQPVAEIDGYTVTANDLYEDMKDVYSISSLLDKIDNKILEEKYPETTNTVINIPPTAP